MMATIIRVATVLFILTLIVGTVRYIRDRNSQLESSRAEAAMFRATAYAYTYAGPTRTPTPVATPTRTPYPSTDPYGAAVDVALERMWAVLGEATSAPEADRIGGATKVVDACRAVQDPEPDLVIWTDYDETLDEAMDACIAFATLARSAWRHNEDGSLEDARISAAAFDAIMKTLDKLDPRSR